MVERSGLTVAECLVTFIERQALPGTGLTAEKFWKGAARIFADLAPQNRVLLDERDDLQARIDEWWQARTGAPADPAEYEAFLHAIGYLAPEPGPFRIAPEQVDEELASMAGPQLVVPALNGRFLLNAANARWGSLYDALYGSDALGSQPQGFAYDAGHGARVIARAKTFLDETFPLASSSHVEVKRYAIHEDGLSPTLADPSQLVGWCGDASAPDAVLLRHNGLHVELVIDRTEDVGRDDPAGLADVLMEAALSTIVDLEDSIAAVDAEDKVAAYVNWLGLMKGDLEVTFDKGGRLLSRTLNPDRVYSAPQAKTLTLPGRALLFVRNVGHLMTTPAVLLADGGEAPEGILDAIVTSLIALHDLKGLGSHRNSRAGSVYIVKPKMHGPRETAFAGQLFDAVEDLLGLSRHTVKIGLMDEERRTSANLAACIEAVKDRLVFINTGFLDRTGDEIRTSMLAGPMLRKNHIRGQDWIKAYEDRNVRIGLACGLSGRAQIGKGMWAAPDRMADMLAQKVEHPRAGATTAWTPSPTAATLHALHYHKVDVFARQWQIASEPIPPLTTLLKPPLALGRNWTAQEIREEIDNNAQGILGYVVRWIDQGIGCSKVPDIHDIGLMEDRATLRISSQHMANWLLHGICSADEIDAALRRMAPQVDEQNKSDPLYRPMAGHEATSIAFQAARALVFEGLTQPNGYTEPLLHSFRRERKQSGRGTSVAGAL